MNRVDLQNLALARIEDSRVLLAQQRYAAAYYLAGYAVECAVKACVARHIVAEEYPSKRRFSEDLFSHDLARLLPYAKLVTELENQKVSDPSFRTNWLIVDKWKETSRYETRTRIEAQELIDAITDGSHGVLTWLQQHW
ncbi:MAG: DNA-binding protein [Chloroflexota bacterium]